MIILLFAASFLCALAFVPLIELGWENLSPQHRIQWTKARAARVAWIIIGILTVAGNFPIGALMAVAGTPVCFAHLGLIGRNPAARLHAVGVAKYIFENARDSFRQFMSRKTNNSIH